MKCIVTENQLNYIESYEKVKKLFFKFWDKNGPLLNDSIFKMFGFNGTVSEISGVRLIRDDIFKFFREWYGVEGMNKAKELLSQNNHHVDCGGYDFNFTIKNFDFNRHGTVEINVVVDLNGATVDLIMVDGDVQDLEDALNSDDYGWEIEVEVQECIFDYFYENLTLKTGYEFVLNSLSTKK